ncbi:unnamed protein product [Sphagnum compactum]
MNTGKPSSLELRLYRFLLAQSPIYNFLREVIRELKEASPKWVQLEEPMLVLDPWASELEAFKKAFFLPWSRPWWTIIGLEHVWAIGVYLVRGAKTLNLIKEFGLSGETLFAGLVDGRNIWADDLAVSVTVIEEFQQALGKRQAKPHGLLTVAVSSGPSKEAGLARVCAGLSSRLQEYRSENLQLEELLQFEVKLFECSLLT